MRQINNMTTFLEKLGVKTEQKCEKFEDIYLSEVKCENLPFVSYGKGFDKESSLISAYGEMCERLITRNFFEEYYVPGLYPDAAVMPDFLNKELKEFYGTENMDKYELVDFNSDIYDILSIPFGDMDGNLTYFPVNLIQNLYASNGMAFHSSLDKAYYNAKTEIIERFVKFKVIKYALPLPKVSHSLNTSEIQIYDATLEGRYPVMAAGYMRDNEIILSFGCDIDKEAAIKKAYSELKQTRFIQKGTLSDDLEHIRSSHNLEKHFVNLSGDVHTNFLKKPYFKEGRWDFRNLTVFGEKEYFKIYKKEKFWAIHLIIPKISEVYPLEEFIQTNINYPKFDRKLVLDFEECKECSIDFLESVYIADIGKYIGVIFDKKYSSEEYTEFVLNGKKPPFSEEYKKILKLAKELY